MIRMGKTQTAHFVRNLVDLGPVPTSSLELDRYHSKILELDQNYLAHANASLKALLGASKDNCTLMSVLWRIC